ncbi:MAG: hypothetical protein IPK53_08640 [bacterium]|nr:hypothetical protein [bacterium]
MVAWRDRLTAQLAPEGALETIGVYAHRLRMSPAEFAASLHDPAWMAEQVFTVVPIASAGEGLIRPCCWPGYHDPLFQLG